MARQRTYDDGQLTEALAAATSWRGVLRQLGLSSASSAEIRSVRRHADHLGLNHDHLGRGARVTAQRFNDALSEAGDWQEAAMKLGLKGQWAEQRMRGHATRLGLVPDNLTVRAPFSSRVGSTPALDNLARAGSMLAAAWFTLCGWDVTWPLEPSRYDLLVVSGPHTRRVQVKTTRARAGESWKVYLATSGADRRTYSFEEIEDFFVIDGSFTYYLIPVDAVGGLQAIHLSAYRRYRVSGAP